MTRYKLQTYQFGIVSGIRQDVSDRISNALPGNLFAPEARKGQLFVLTEAVNDSARGKEACDLVAAMITRTYYKDSSFSITSSLRNALKVANTTLYEHNYKAAQHQKTAVSVTCAVLRDNDLYIAQVQPTQAYIAHKGQLRAMPTYPSWQAGASSPALMPANALGTSLFSEPELFRNVVEPGDEIILCSSRLARVLGRVEAERLFCLEDAPSALEELYTIARRNTLHEAHVAVLELLPLVMSSVQPLSAEGLSERGKAAASVVGDWISDVTGNAALTLRRPQHAPDETTPDANAPADGQPVSALSETPTLPSVLDEIDPRDMGWLQGRSRVRARQTGDVEMWPPSAYLGETSLAPALHAAIGRQAPVDLSDNQPLPVDFAAIPQRDPIQPPSFGERIFMPFRYLLAALVTFFINLGRRKRPSARAMPRFESSSRGGGLSYRREKRRRVPIVPLVLLIGAVALAYLWVQNTTLQNAEARYQNALNRASAQFATANAAPADADALKALDDLEITLDTIAADAGLLADATRQAEYRRIRANANQLRGSIERTSVLTDLQPVATMPISDTIGRLLVVPQGASAEIYFVGSESGSLYRKTEGSTETPAVVLKDGESVPPFITRPIRSMVLREGVIAAIDDEQSSSIYIAQSDGSWAGVRLDGSEFWPAQPFPDIETFGGSLYIWQWGPDTDGEILKYSVGEYTSLPSEWITSVLPGVNLQTAVDMVIDGQIYLLQPNGAIEVLEAGEHLTTLPAPDLQPPLRASKMFRTVERATETSDNLGHFFILDTVNARIVELDADGKVVQQLSVPAASGSQVPLLTDLAVTLGGVQGARLYVVNGGQVLSSPLPAPPSPRQIAPAASPAAPTATP